MELSREENTSLLKMRTDYQTALLSWSYDQKNFTKIVECLKVIEGINKSLTQLLKPYFLIIDATKAKATVQRFQFFARLTLPYQISPYNKLIEKAHALVFDIKFKNTLDEIFKESVIKAFYANSIDETKIEHYHYGFVTKDHAKSYEIQLYDGTSLSWGSLDDAAQLKKAEKIFADVCENLDYLAKLAH